MQTSFPHQEASLLLPVGSDGLRHPLTAFHHLRGLPAGDGCFPPRRPKSAAPSSQCGGVCRQPCLHLVHCTAHRGPLCSAVPPSPTSTDQLRGTSPEDHRIGAGAVTSIRRAFLLVVRHVEEQPSAHGARLCPHMDSCNYHLFPALQYFLCAELLDNSHPAGEKEAAALSGRAPACAAIRENHGYVAGYNVCFLCPLGAQDCGGHLPPVRLLSSQRLARPPGLRPVQHAGHAQHSGQLLPILFCQQALS